VILSLCALAEADGCGARKTTRLAERDQGKRLFDLLRCGDVLVGRWIDRLGRNYEDVTEVIRAQAEATKEARRAGIDHAKARADAYRGRKPSFTREQLDQVRDMLTTETSISTVAKTTGLSRQAIYRLKSDPAWAAGVLETWAA
jgi:putative DNA-invertase from lambdoid prophage Rac